MTEQEIEAALYELQNQEEELRQKKRDLQKHLVDVRAEAKLATMSPGERDALVRVAALKAGVK